MRLISICAFNYNASNNDTINAYASAGYGNWNNPNGFYTGDMCPIAGYYRTEADGNSAIIIMPDGKVLMHNFHIGLNSKGITGETKILGCHEYDSSTYQFEIDLSKFDKPYGVDDATWEAATQSGLNWSSSKGLYYDKNRKAFSNYTKFGNWLGKHTASPEYTTQMKVKSNNSLVPVAYDLSFTSHFESFNPGDVVQANARYNEKCAPDVTDLSMLSVILVDKKNEINKNGNIYANSHVNVLNADVNLNGSIDLDDLANLQQIIRHKISPDRFIKDFLTETYDITPKKKN